MGPFYVNLRGALVSPDVTARIHGVTAMVQAPSRVAVLRLPLLRPSDPGIIRTIV